MALVMDDAYNALPLAVNGRPKTRKPRQPEAARFAVKLLAYRPYTAKLVLSGTQNLIRRTGGLSPAVATLITRHPYRRVIEALSKHEF